GKRDSGEHQKPRLSEDEVMEGGIVEGGMDTDRDGKPDEPGKQRMLHATEGKACDRHADDGRRAAVHDRGYESARSAENQPRVHVYAAQVQHVLGDGETDPRRETVDRTVDKKRG